jgi:hypothetical protein
VRRWRSCNRSGATAGRRGRRSGRGGNWIQLSVKRDYRRRAGERGGITDDISNAAEGLGNALFPPSPAGKITTGSNNVLTNAIPAARAAGTLTPADTPSPEPQSPGSFADYAGMLLSAAGQFGSEMWQPSVASAAAGTSPLEEDKVACEKHSGPQYLAEGSKASSSTDSPRCVPKIAPPAKAPFPTTSPRT